ncbi:hypothetical protein ACHAXA_011223 [Cyclostephanos tholiformis]|uniref:Uncharacterized protein n=1 Tax=Cyclostephanos tholiformis TaxID=382380 RepID=A0ABD3RFB0_9STRA
MAMAIVVIIVCHGVLLIITSITDYDAMGEGRDFDMGPYNVTAYSPSPDIDGLVIGHDVDEGRTFRPTRNHRTIMYRRGGIDGGYSHNINDDENDDGDGPPDVRISFELHDPNTLPLTNVFDPHVLCPIGEVTIGRNRRRTGQNRTGGLPPSLVRVAEDDDGGGGEGEYRDGRRRVDVDRRSSGGRVLDFTASLTTNLRIMFVGDSVLVQLAQAVDEFLLEGRTLESRKIGDRSVLWEAWTGHDGGSILAPTRGGGVSATWRMTGLLSMANEGKPPANSVGGGWSRSEIDKFLHHRYRPSTPPTTTTQSSMGRRGESAWPSLYDDNSTIAVGNFDVVVFRVMHGWMELHEITHDRLVEAVSLSRELLGASVVVLMTVPFTNNVKTAEDIVRVREINDDIRNIARAWHSRTNVDDDVVDGVRHVLVLEYGTYVNHIIWSNARHLNYSVTHPLEATLNVFDSEGPTFLLDRLDDETKFPPNPAVVCSRTPNRGKCDRNSLFRDGMHICPETLASRYAAGIACLLGCVYNRRARTNSAIAEERIRICEGECNGQFLSVMPVEESLIDKHITLASFSG